MNAIKNVTYVTDTGELVVTYDRPEWVVVDNGTTHRFPSVPAWIGYARTTHGWPLALKAQS
jgi:hypothetical protein